jgi:tetratricopeptide (TPR) repeat protein
MVATQATNLSKWDGKIQASAEEVYEGFRNVLDWTEGFGLVFVQCSPVQGGELVEQIKKDLPNEQVGILQFQEGEEIRNLYDLVEQLPNREQIDILFIRGLEYSFVPYIKSGYGGQGDYYKLDNLPPILGHLNLQRERFKQDFDICFVFLLPFFGIKYFIQRAPDFFDWRSGLFEIARERDFVHQQSIKLILEGDYDQYCQWNFSQRITRILEIETLLKEDLKPEDKSSLLFEQGNLWAAGSDYEEAIASYDQALKIKPDYLNAWVNRGNALRNLGRIEEAIASYDQALKIKPDDPDAWVNRGNALRNLGRIEEALASYDQALEIKPDYPEAWYNRGNALGNLGRIEEALASYDQALEIKPDYPEAWYNRGNALRNLGRIEEAIASYDSTLKSKPDDHQAWGNRGNALFNLGRLEEAIASYDQALKIKPDDHEAWNNRGIALRNLGRLEEAITSYENALKFKPDLHEAWYNRGFVLLNLGRLEEAITSYDNALKLKPDDANAYYNKACAYALQENILLALDNLKQSMNLDSQYLEMAKTDTDFNKIRHDSRFINLLNIEH